MYTLKLTLLRLLSNHRKIVYLLSMTFWVLGWYDKFDMYLKAFQWYMNKKKFSDLIL